MLRRVDLIAPEEHPERSRTEIGRIRGTGRCVEPRVDTENDLAALLRRQDGVVTRAQALACGLSRAAIKHRLARGLWTLLWPRVYLSASHAFGPRARLRGASLWLGPSATLIGVGATWWWRLVDEPPDVLRFAVPPSRRVRSRGGVVAVRRRLPGRRSTVDGVPVVSKAYAVVDAAAELGLRRGAELMDRALLSERVTLEALRSAHRSRLGRPGSRTVARLLALAAGGARSEAERRVHALLRSAGVTGWAADLRVVVPDHGVAVLDIAFPGSRVLVEVDGWAYHRDLPAFRRDQERQNALVLVGWTVLRVNWHLLESDSEAVLAMITGALRAAGAGSRSRRAATTGPSRARRAGG
ncbi:type IV toxin-antitoxin system AbiEi family antitoxin domain-containing protein [Actinomycetospora lutea]|uniref:endonuclease domain-containing protein n=1 Tax=Actinomycetospora lutea TaxID=663604 RepID=UPI0023664451|nr:type IV toxin-antitoxin system AbiEi family antitoxin domain-containing protein [Actinomycetospora lutea]MDD7940836.1 type IV toxin-antitoxin system AbiEi family antitoxin domain-containing protein [Actinomycetospora lutea]